MDRVKENEIALRDECERLARQAEREGSNTALMPEQRAQALDQAKAYWQLSASHASAALRAEIERPTRFTGQHKGKTVERECFLREVAKEIGSTKRADVCRAAQAKPGFSKLFKSYEAAYRACKPSIFD